MELPALLVSDPHFTAEPADEYRWALWPWLVEQCKKHNVKTLVIAGDLTDKKDNHPAKLTNRLVHAIKSIPQAVRVLILKGNHDYLLDGHSYFEFLNVLPNVTFIVKPFEDVVRGEATMFMPHTKTPAKDWQGMDFSHYRYLFLHQTISGAVASNGEKMDGELLPPLNAAKVYSGDIHVPQVIGGIEYIGSPYHVHFGDSFKARCILLDRKGTPTDLYFDTIKRVTLRVQSLRELKRCDIGKGDQVKVEVQLTEAEKHEWSRIRREASEWLTAEGTEVFGVKLVVKRSRKRVGAQDAQSGASTPADAVLKFVMDQDFGPDMYEDGLACLEKDK
jgi:hypothetical protein